VSGLLPRTGRSLQSVDELPEGSQAQQNGCAAAVSTCLVKARSAWARFNVLRRSVQQHRRPV